MTIAEFNANSFTTPAIYIPSDAQILGSTIVGMDPINTDTKSFIFDGQEIIEIQLNSEAKDMKAGCLPGFKISPDFNEPLEEFKEYM